MSLRRFSRSRLFIELISNSSLVVGHFSAMPFEFLPQDLPELFSGHRRGGVRASSLLLKSGAVVAAHEPLMAVRALARASAVGNVHNWRITGWHSSLRHSPVSRAVFR